jgi:hypothetical protein
VVVGSVSVDEDDSSGVVVEVGAVVSVVVDTGSVVDVVLVASVGGVACAGTVMSHSNVPHCR